MTITRIDAIPYAIPYTHPLRFASGEVHTADHVLVRIHTSEGVVASRTHHRAPTPTGRPSGRSSRSSPSSSPRRSSASR